MNTLTNERLGKLKGISAVSQLPALGINPNELHEMVSRLLAAEAQLAELRGQEPVVRVSEESFSSDGTSYILTINLPIGMELFSRPVPPAASQPSYRDGIEAAANWIDTQREAFDNEHGRHDPDTGTFEFGNDAQLEHSSTLAELSEGIRSLHPSAIQPYTVPGEWRNSLQEMVDAMRQYEMDVGECPPKKHRRMMRRADKLLNACRTAMLQSDDNGD